MSAVRIRYEVVHVPAGEEFDKLQPQEEGTWPRDLLPWADPYIASLMMQLSRRRGEVEGLLDDELALCALSSDAWRDDPLPAAYPLADRRESFLDPPFPPIYGGFPLLDDQSV
jgi:hypothetical protein